ncbi:hypothetical protein J3E69DRAFT_200721 [Trichoderma sp. SZMC 28015]
MSRPCCYSCTLLTYLAPRASRALCSMPSQNQISVLAPSSSLAAKSNWPSSIEWRDRNTHARGTRDETHPAGLRLSYDISGVSHAEASPFAACDAMHTMQRLAGFVWPVRHACSSTNASAIFSSNTLHLIPRSSTRTHSYIHEGISPTPVFLLSCSRRENEERARKRKSILAKKLCHTLICLLRQTPHFVSAPEYVAGRLRKKTEKREKKLDISRVGWQKMTPTRAASGFRFA